MKRSVILVLALTAMIALSGCALLSGETLEFTASQATVSDQALDSAQYQETTVESRNVTQSVSAAGQEREVRLTNWIANYQRDLGGVSSQASASVTVLSTPGVEIAGQALNPIGSMGPRELLDTVGEGSQLSDVEETGTRTVTVLGEETEVTTFSGTLTLQGTPVDVTIHLTSVKHQGDHVVAVGVHPQEITAEQADIDTMFGGIEHSGD